MMTVSICHGDVLISRLDKAKLDDEWEVREYVLLFPAGWSNPFQNLLIKEDQCNQRRLIYALVGILYTRTDVLDKKMNKYAGEEGD